MRATGGCGRRVIGRHRLSATSPIECLARSFVDRYTEHKRSGNRRSGMERGKRFDMAARKQFKTRLTVSPSLKRLLEEAKGTEVTEDELHEQRVSFAFGNAPESDLITKDSVRSASKRIRIGQ